MQFDSETQEMCMRLLELQEKQELTGQEREEAEALLAKLPLAEAEHSGYPMAKATLVAEEVAYQEAFKKAAQAGLSRLGVHIVAVTAAAKARGDAPSEAEKFIEQVYLRAPSADRPGRLDSGDISEAIDEAKRNNLWPWKGSN